MALIIQDNFNGEASEVNLTAHITTLNSYSWASDNASSNIYVHSAGRLNQASHDSTSEGNFPEYYVSNAPTLIDYISKSKVKLSSNATNNTVVGVRGRRVSDTQEIWAALVGNATAGNRMLALLVNITTVASFAINWNSGQFYEIEIECKDSATLNEIDCVVKLNGITRITHTITVAEGGANFYGLSSKPGVRGVSTGSLVLSWDDFEVNDFSQTIVGSGSTNLTFDGNATLKGGIVVATGSTSLAFDGSAVIEAPVRATAQTSLAFSGATDLTFDFSFKWSIDHLEASTTHGFPSVYVQVSNVNPPSGTFNDLSGTVFDRRLLEMPRLQEIQLDERSGLAGFQRVTLQAGNSDGLLNGLDMQDSFVRIFFVDADGDDYKEFNGKVVDWTLSHTVTINVEDLDALAFTQELPKRTLNDLVETEKEALAGQEQTDFENSVIADDLGKPIPIIFGRAVKVPLLYVKADETLIMDESKREYDYIIGEGVGLNNNNFGEVFRVYREAQALDDHSFTTVGASSVPNTINLPDGLKRPSSWYKYWWVSALGVTSDVTEYDEETNRITFSTSGGNVTVPNGTTVTLREWRFYPGSQVSPYAGYAFLRFKKRLGNAGSTDQLYADVNGLQSETNRAQAVQSVLSNSEWGLGIPVNDSSFTTAALALDNLTCEGAIIEKTSATDLIQKLLSYRDMVLFKGDNIEISLDGIKDIIAHNLGLGDETGYNNILNQSPSINFKHPDQKVKDLKVRYRKNYKESDTYLKERTRSSGTNGIDETIDLPFVYNHEIADKFLDYKRKRFAAADRNLSLDIGEDGKKAKRGERVTVDIPSLGIASDWEITSSNVTPAGSNTVNLVPYSATAYTYDPDPDLPTDETGIDEPFDIPPDFTNTPPEPVTGESAAPGFEIQDDLTRIGFIDVTWTPPSDGNYLEGKVKTKVSGAADSTYIEHPHGFDRVRATPLRVGLTYDLLVSSVNINNLESYALPITGIFIPGDITVPKTPENVIGKGKFNKVSWEWDAVTENADFTPIEDLKGYEYRVWDHPTTGNQVYPKDQSIGFTTDTRVEITDSDGNLTANDRTLYCEVRAVDDSGNPTGAEDGWTARVSASTGEVTRPDIPNNDITIQYTSSNDAPITLTVGAWTEIISVAGTYLAGQEVFIHIAFNFRFAADAAGGSATFAPFRVRKDGTTTIGGLPQVPRLSVVGEEVPISRTVDDTPGAGVHTYSVEVQSTDPLVLTTQAKNRRIDITEFRR